MTASLRTKMADIFDLFPVNQQKYTQNVFTPLLYRYVIAYHCQQLNLTSLTPIFLGMDVPIKIGGTFTDIQEQL